MQNPVKINFVFEFHDDESKELTQPHRSFDGPHDGEIVYRPITKDQLVAAMSWFMKNQLEHDLVTNEGKPLIATILTEEVKSEN